MQQRSEETRAVILKSALRLFSHSGFDATAVADICAAAGVSKGAFYHHFPSKQAVFMALLKDWLADLDRGLSAAAQNAGEVPQELAQMAASAAGIFADASGRLPMFLEFWTQSARDPEVWKETIAPYRMFLERFAGILQKGIDEGSLRPVDARMAARVLISLGIGTLLQSLLDPQAADWDTVLQAGMEIYTRGLKGDYR